MTAIRAVVESHTGYVRTNNEDLAVVGPTLAAVADGMGGHLGGEVAARTAIEQIVESFLADGTADGLVRSVQEANEAIWRRGRTDASVHGMGTTITAVALVPASGEERRLALVNVGDSRAYELDRSSGEPHLRRLTEDHSVVEEMVRAGELSEAEAAVHPHRHVLTRVLGMDPQVDVDLFDLEPKPGLRLLLCSDGLSDDVPESAIEGALTSSEDPREAAKALVQVALAHGGNDNVTVAVVDVVDDPPPTSNGPLEYAPGRPEGPETGADAFREDVTQALRVMVPGSQAEEGGGEPTAAVDMSALVGAEAAPGSGDGPEPTVRDAAGPGAPSAELFDVEAEEEEAPAGEPAEEDEAEPPGEKKRPRSLVVRARAPALLPETGPVTGAHPRTTVLVPTSRRDRPYRDRVLTVRVVLFVLVLAALLGGVIAVVIWFQRSSYFVGLDQNRVSIFQGRPGGFLWFKPQLLERSNLTVHNLLPNSLAEVKKGISESSYAAARRQIHDLGKLSSQVGLAPRGGTTTSTTPAGKSSIGVTPRRRPDRASLLAVVSPAGSRSTMASVEGVPGK